jgi:hypothetical protein
MCQKVPGDKAIIHNLGLQWLHMQNKQATVK